MFILYFINIYLRYNVLDLVLIQHQSSYETDMMKIYNDTNKHKRNINHTKYIYIYKFQSSNFAPAAWIACFLNKNNEFDKKVV